MSTELNFDLYQRSCASVCASCLLTQQHNDPRCVVYNLVLKMSIVSFSLAKVPILPSEFQEARKVFCQ